MKKDIPPLPEKFSILTYVPFKRWDFYNGDMILKLAEALPEVDFHILASEGKRITLPNVHTYGFVKDITPFYKNSSVLIRITKHDGLAKMILEALSCGRQVLRNMPFPHCILVNNLEDCINTLNSLKRKQELNLEGKAFVEQNFNQEKILDNYYSLCKNVIKPYINEV
jgi:glycosyltransferase involved in cell wall biosynthesis